MFLPAERGCCKEEGIRKDFLEDGWKNDHGKGKEDLPAEERTCKCRGRAMLYPWAPGTTQLDRAPHTEPRDEAGESGGSRW